MNLILAPFQGLQKRGDSKKGNNLLNDCLVYWIVIKLKINFILSVIIHFMFSELWWFINLTNLTFTLNNKINFYHFTKNEQSRFIKKFPVQKARGYPQSRVFHLVHGFFWNDQLSTYFRESWENQRKSRIEALLRESYFKDQFRYITEVTSSTCLIWVFGLKFNFKCFWKRWDLPNLIEVAVMLWAISTEEGKN